MPFISAKVFLEWLSIQVLGNALEFITYSASRGILMTRFQGTALGDFCFTSSLILKFF
jgi:hypothetical protein